MKLKVPPKIVWKCRGPVTSYMKQRLIAQARHCADLLLRNMKFQGLSQGRLSKAIGDYVFNCTSIFGVENVHVSLLATVGGVSEDIALICWCRAQMAVGVVLEVIPEDDTPGNCFPAVSVEYPDCALNSIGQYVGTRYRVQVCQGNRTEEYVCLGTDFASYDVGVAVIVLFLDAWGTPPTGKAACSVVPRVIGESEVYGAVDGQFVILPYSPNFGLEFETKKS